MEERGQPSATEPFAAYGFLCRDSASTKNNFRIGMVLLMIKANKKGTLLRLIIKLYCIPNLLQMLHKHYSPVGIFIYKLKEQ